MYIGVLASLATLLGVPALCFMAFLLIFKGDFRKAASALRLVVATLLLFIPFVCYCLLGMYVNLKTTDPVLGTSSLVLLFLMLLLLIKLTKGPP